jgi:hypothetical protein
MPRIGQTELADACRTCGRSRADCRATGEPIITGGEANGLCEKCSRLEEAQRDKSALAWYVSNARARRF